LGQRKYVVVSAGGWGKCYLTHIFAMTCTYSHVNKSKGTHQLVVGGIIAAAAKDEKKTQPHLALSKGKKNTKEMESWCMPFLCTFLGA